VGSSLWLVMATATPALYTLSLHDALPIWPLPAAEHPPRRQAREGPLLRPLPQRPGDPREPGAAAEGLHGPPVRGQLLPQSQPSRSEEHTSELQSRENLVCRLLLEKKNNNP